MIRARACAALLALLAACIDFPDGESYKCAADSAGADCPTGWSCTGGRCVDPSSDLGSACAAACTNFYDCGYAGQCQAESLCPYTFLYEPEAGSCAESCASDPEGTTPALLICYSQAECTIEAFEAC